ncbi:g2551 [Coccomyxa elongata]
MGPDYLAATDRFPFLDAKDRQHAEWFRFCIASTAKATVLRDADLGAAPQVPQTPPALPPVQQLAVQLPPVEQLLPVGQPPLGLAANINLIKEVPGALAAPSGGWTAAALYARYSEPLKAGVPSLREIMVQQGHIDWARLRKDEKVALWRNKFWSCICCEVHGGKELQQALKDAQDKYDGWGSMHRAKMAKLMGDKCARRGFKA